MFFGLLYLLEIFFIFFEFVFDVNIFFIILVNLGFNGLLVLFLLLKNFDNLCKVDVLLLFDEL